MFTSTEIKKSGLPKEKVTRLKNKHTGGLNQKNGKRYEDYFTLYKILKNASNVLDGKNRIEILDQAKNCFLDDLVIRKNKKNVDFYQLKNTQQLSWNQNLLGDFEDQKKLSGTKKIKSSLTLVVSQNKIFKKLLTMPSNAFLETFIKHFPEPKNTEDLIRNFVGVRELVKDISALQNPSIMNMDYLLKNIMGEWTNYSQKKFIDLKTLLDKSNRESTPIKTKWVNNKKWKAAKAIIDKIPNLIVYTDKGILEYHMKLNRTVNDGFVMGKPGSRELNRFFDRIISGKPKNINEFERLL